MKRTGFRRKPKSAEQKADELFSRRIRERDGHQCRRCGSTWMLDAAHVIRRGYHATRWVLRNAVCLCRSCHDYMGGRDIEWRNWCLAQDIPYDNLHWLALHDKPERPEDALERLRAA